MKTLTKLMIPVATTLAIAAGVANAQPQQPPPQPGRGSGWGMGPGMMGGYGPASGMGPGMMGGYGFGPGERGGYGSAYGMGPGMMGGGGGFGMMGPGMMGALWHLDLTDAQRQQVLKIQDELRRKNWEILGKQQDEQAKLRDAYFGAGKRDRAAIVATYKRISDLRLQRIENALVAAEEVEGLLTPQQRESLKRWGPWWAPDGP